MHVRLQHFVFQLYKDLSTWRSELKKAAISSTPLFYKLEPAPGIECHDRVAFIQDAAAALLTQSIFLRDGVDENVSSSLHADFI